MYVLCYDIIFTIKKMCGQKFHYFYHKYQYNIYLHNQTFIRLFLITQQSNLFFYLIVCVFVFIEKSGIKIINFLQLCYSVLKTLI